MSSPESTTIYVAPAEENERLDRFLARRFPEQSRTYFQTLIDERCVTVNEQPCKKRYKLQVGDQIDIDFILTPEIALEPEDIPLDIIYEDDDLIAVNKAAGLVVHPGPGNWSSTFVNALLYHCKQIEAYGDPSRPGIVHRLDKETSGLLLAAKTERCHRKLALLFAERQIRKEYLAITVGRPVEGRVEFPIGRHPTKRKQMTVREGGKPAISHFKPLAWDGTLAVVRVLLETGRTHQIRVHLQHMGCPILGDQTYGSARAAKLHGASRTLLHAHTLDFTHPISGAFLHLEAPLPADIAAFTNKI